MPKEKLRQLVASLHKELGAEDNRTQSRVLCWRASPGISMRWLAPNPHSQSTMSRHSSRLRRRRCASRLAIRGWPACCSRLPTHWAGSVSECRPWIEGSTALVPRQGPAEIPAGKRQSRAGLRRSADWYCRRSQQPFRRRRNRRPAAYRVPERRRFHRLTRRRCRRHDQGYIRNRFAFRSQRRACHFPVAAQPAQAVPGEYGIRRSIPGDAPGRHLDSIPGCGLDQALKRPASNFSNCQAAAASRVSRYQGSSWSRFGFRDGSILNR